MYTAYALDQACAGNTAQGSELTDWARVAGRAIVAVEPLAAWRMRAIKRWEKLVLVQCCIRRKQHLFHALGNSLRTLRPCLRMRLYETDQVRDVDTRARSSGFALAPQRVAQAIGARHLSETERGRDGDTRTRRSGVGHGPQMVVQAIGALPRVRERIPAWKSSPAWQ